MTACQTSSSQSYMLHIREKLETEVQPARLVRAGKKKAKSEIIPNKTYEYFAGTE